MIGRIARNGAVAAIVVAGLYGLVWLYDTSLRDPRYFDGWLLFAGMALQILFSLRRKFPRLAVGQVTVWMQVHIYCGYTVVAVFLLHTQLRLPDAGIEWALWSLFAALVASGATGAYLVKVTPSKLATDITPYPLEYISYRQAQIAREVDELVVASTEGIGAAALTGLYDQTLQQFFRRPRNLLAHIRHSKRPLQIIFSQLDALERYLDSTGKETLRSIRNRIVAKNDLDFQYAHQGLLVVWLFVHIPATYGITVLALAHAAVVHAYSAGV
ncbi:MAG: hypothetical protein OER56_01775 [Hyphomicrobiales bacterium]|nr:hypothetical protein [Hyphomicrobiales bacterium]